MSLIKHYMKMTRKLFWRFLHNTGQFLTYVKGVPFFHNGVRKGQYLFYHNSTQKGKGLDLGAEPHCQYRTL